MRFNVFKRFIIMCFILSSLIFSGCASGFRSTKPEGEISSVSVTQNHMNRTDCYSFSAYLQDEDYYLNAWCFLESGDDENDVREVNIENVPIAKEEFEEFSEFDKKYDFFNLKTKEKKGNKFFQVLDKTTNTFTVSYNGESVNIETSGECYEEVYNYFMILAEKYSN